MLTRVYASPVSSLSRQVSFVSSSIRGFTNCQLSAATIVRATCPKLNTRACMCCLPSLSLFVSPLYIFHVPLLRFLFVSRALNRGARLYEQLFCEPKFLAERLRFLHARKANRVYRSTTIDRHRERARSRVGKRLVDISARRPSDSSTGLEPPLPSPPRVSPSSLRLFTARVPLSYPSILQAHCAILYGSVTLKRS